MSKKKNIKPRAKTAPKSEVKTVNTVKKKCLTEYIVVNIICLFVFLAFGYIAIMSFFQTSVLDPDKYVSEHILFQNDMIVLNILLTVLFVIFLFAMRRFYDFFAKVNITIMEIALAGFVLILGLIWVINVQSVPAADSYNIFEAATDAAKGEYTSMYNDANFYNNAFYSNFSYFHFYPFQLGFVAFCEFFYRIFGTESSMPIQIINVLCVSGAYFALAKITGMLFKRKSAEFIAILLLAVCFQPILFCTFVYGNIIGMCCAIWASFFLIKYFQTGQYRWIYPSGILLVLATLVKYNNMIYLVAFVIMLLVHIIKKKRWQSAVIAAALIVAVLGSNSLVIMHYESRAETTFESGVSQVQYLDLGLQESYMAPGWYTTIAKDNYINLFLAPKYRGNIDVDSGNADAKAWEDIDERTTKFAEDFDYMFDFFSKKILSQWNEPTYESIWVSKVKSHTATEEQEKKLHSATVNSEQMTGLTHAMYYKSLGQWFELHSNFFMQIVYIMFAAGIYLLFVNKKSNIETVLLPLVLLGAFGYHLLFEGKSQYILTYIPLLIPTAAYAFSVMLGGKYERIKKLVKKINHIPNRFEEKETADKQTTKK